MFEREKEETMQNLENAVAEGKVDPAIRETLELINAHEAYYTTSSCAGRIVLIWLPALGGKKNATFLRKWHNPVEYEELLDALEFRDSGVTFLISQSPILHIASRDITSARRLLNLSFSSGFKNSGIKSINERTIVEILSTERIDVPLGEKELLADEKHLKILVKYANNALKRSRKKLKRLNKKLEKLL